ncbi:MAG: hypothetical protein II171_03535 [Bacteroidales bacterium]|nr:hypothetical protein [Bacteroidales bacterium]
MEFSEFILAHDGDDVGMLALQRKRFSDQVEDFDLALTTLECRQKLRSKVPEWYAVPALRYPLRLSAEQCSSSETARYKASVALAAVQSGKSAHFADGARIADLTGGLGVDSWAFAQVFDEVLYNEMRPELAEAVRFNFRTLGMERIQVRNTELTKGSLAAVLGGFRPDILFLDPARRAADGRKVFRLEDCQPDVLQLLPELLDAAPLVLLKLSPMADITQVSRQLGCVREVHVVAAGGECKELLLLLEKGYEGPVRTTIYDSGAVLVVARMAVGGVAKRRFGEQCAIACRDQFLFEPGRALLKAGAFDLPCGYGLQKLGRHTHLYVGEGIPEELKPFGKCFRILEVVPLDKRNLKLIGQKYPQAEVTARNIPLASDQLRARLGVRSGGSIHIFGVHVDHLSDNYLFILDSK